MSIGIDSVERLLEHRRVRAGGQRHVVAAVHNEIVDALTVSVERSAVQREDATVEPARARPGIGPSPLVPVLGARTSTRGFGIFGGGYVCGLFFKRDREQGRLKQRKKKSLNSRKEKENFL